MKALSPVSRRPREGFTLIEVMMVVALIGMLAAVAVPNFQKYQSKAKTSEAKIQLAAAYTGMRAFLLTYYSYTGCLGAAGYVPDLGTTTNNTKRYYAVGFTSGSQGSACGPNGGYACEASWGNGNPTCTTGFDGTNGGNAPVTQNGTVWRANMISKSTATPATVANLSGTGVTQGTFTVGAAGHIDAQGTTYDKWQINDGKIISQIVVGY